jgi:tetratricopeptide (TPR) repeat protein
MNRALCAQRIGMLQASATAWHAASTLETSPEWRSDAAERERTVTRSIQPATEPPETLFLTSLTDSAAVGKGLPDVLTTDRLASDTATQLSLLSQHDRERLASALRTYADGREAFAKDELTAACSASSAAEGALTSLKSPLALLVREQHIRCQCTRAQTGCLDRIRSLRTELVGLRRYPWLSARTAYAEGQTLYRQGRIYDAAESFHSALDEFAAVGDSASVGLTHSVLGNTYAAAGESDAALEHHLAAIRLRFHYRGDRRRIELEDAMLFLLRHDYVSAAELLLDEMASAPATAAGRAMEAALRGVIAFRNGHVQNSEHQFDHARLLLDQVDDRTLRAETRRSVLLAEAGTGIGSSRRRLADIEATTTMAEREETSLYLPRMLTERGIAFEAAGEPVRAEQDYLRAMSILESRELRIDQSSLVLGPSTAQDSAFDHAIVLYLKQRRVADALSAAERSLSVRISSLYARGMQGRDMFRSDRGDAASSIGDIQESLRAGQVAVALYLLKDAVITWIVTPSGVSAVRRPIGAEQLIDVVARLHSCASIDACRDDPELERASNLLLRDWIQQVPRGATLWLQKPVELQALPFAMLTTQDGEPLLLRNPITTVSDLGELIRVQSRDAARAGSSSALFLAAAHPRGSLEPLPTATWEVTQAARSYRGARVDVQARRRTFGQGALPYAVIHFAGHVLVNDEQPLFSALVFDDGLLYIHELDPRAFSRARLVVLAGCDTGRAPKPRMSVADALLSQHVPSVVYTLWPVDDASAADFAVAFHQAISAGKSRAESVQQAAASIRRAYPDRSSAWAAFQLAGAPGPITKTRRRES